MEDAASSLRTLPSLETLSILTGDRIWIDSPDGEQQEREIREHTKEALKRVLSGLSPTCPNLWKLEIYYYSGEPEPCTAVLFDNTWDYRC